jgi:glycosyltransferase involved in cell wall biosynthesis
LKIAYFILNNFDFDSRARLEVETLGAMGHHVEIIATIGCNSKSYLGFPIHRIPQWRYPTRKFRFLQYNHYAAWVGRRLAADIYHSVDLDTLQAAFWASGGKGKIIYEARELYTELEALSGRPRTQAIWRALERKLIGKTDKVITINESIAKELCIRYGIEKPVVIRNVGRLPKEIKPIDFRKRFEIPADWKVLIYQGVLRRGQGLPYLLEVMAGLENVVLILVGSGPIEDELKAETTRLNLNSKVRFTGQVPPDELANYTAGATAGILFMEDVALNNKLALPQKLFQYLAAGIPQIVSPMPELSGFVESEGTGLVVPLGNSQSAARLIAEFFSDNSRYDKAKANCAVSAPKNNWDVESAKLVELYQCLERGQ